MNTSANVGRNAALAAFLGILGFGIAQTAQLLGLLAYPADEIAIYAASLCIA